MYVNCSLEHNNLDLISSGSMESLRRMPPVPGTPRVAAKDQCIDGVFIPKGTLLPIHVCCTLYLCESALKLLQIRTINTLKSVWGEDAEE